MRIEKIGFRAATKVAFFSIAKRANLSRNGLLPKNEQCRKICGIVGRDL